MYIEGEVPNVVTTSGSGFTGGNGSFLGGDGIWAIILFALIFGYGRNGFGGGFGGGNIGENYVLATDFATIERKLDSVNSGICDATFALNNTITNGNFNILNAITQAGAGLNTALLQGNYALSTQLSDCCCKTQRAIDGINYNLATNTCAITNAINTGVRDIVDNQNANYRAIHEELVANKIEAKNERISELQDKLYRADLRASQAQQSNYITDTIINKLSPCPSPSYIVPNPNCCYNYNVTGYGYGSPCGASVL